MLFACEGIMNTITPITAEMVTDEMIQIMAYYCGYVPADKEIIAAAVNAYLGTKK
jgi:hypothetical protein